MRVADNIFLGRARTRCGMVLDGSQRAEARTLLAQLGVEVDVDRNVEELVRQSWNELESAARRLELLEQQVIASEQVRRSYQQQFNIGQRTLLDLLDSETALFNSRVSRATIDYALIFARYRVIAATGKLLRTIGINPPAAANSDARREAGAPVTR